MLHCDSAREADQKTIYQSGKFSYEYIADYAKGLPDNVAKASIAAVARIRREISIWACGEIRPRW